MLGVQAEAWWALHEQRLHLDSCMPKNRAMHRVMGSTCIIEGCVVMQV